MTPAQILGEVFYSIIGLVFILVGAKALKDEGCSKKLTTAAFWFLLAFTFIAGPWVPKWLVGAAIVIMANSNFLIAIYYFLLVFFNYCDKYMNMV